MEANACLGSREVPVVASGIRITVGNAVRVVSGDVDACIEWSWEVPVPRSHPLAPFTVVASAVRAVAVIRTGATIEQEGKLASYVPQSASGRSLCSPC